jgi:NADPH2:quinone reductase
MRAVVCRAFGGPHTLKVEDMPSRPLAAGQVRVAVAAAGVNFADTLIIEGKYQEKPAFPFIPGMEAAGVVREVAGDVTTIRVGDRVAGTVEGGAFTEEAIARASDIYVIPKEMDFAAAAGFPVAYGTSEVALHHRGHLKAGETLLVLGAAGGVGLTAVEIGKAMGARVIAAARGADKLEVAHTHGADFCIDYAAEDLRTRVKEITGDAGANVVFDPVGGDAFDAALRVTAWEGRILVIGFAAGRIPQAPANLLLVKNISVTGVYWGAYRRREITVVRESFARLFGWWREGKLKPHISHRLELAEIGAAMDLLLSRKSTGKVVLMVNKNL